MNSEFIEQKIASLNNQTLEIPKQIDWGKMNQAYEHYPSLRHRIRFIIKRLKSFGINQDSFVFDYGCGIGTTLLPIKKSFSIDDNQLGGYDIQENPIRILSKELDSPYLFSDPAQLNSLPKKPNIIICSEVIEHTPYYCEILDWISNELRSKGIAIITSQTGYRCKFDKYVGHTQHFELEYLTSLLKERGLKIKEAYTCGFPFYWLQKRVGDLFYEKLRVNFHDTTQIGPIKKLIFDALDLLFFCHNFIKTGPQIFIVAEKD